MDSHNDCTIMQAPSLNYYIFDNTPSLGQGIVNNTDLNDSQMIEILYLGNNLYLLTTAGVIKLEIDSSSCEMALN